MDTTFRKYQVEPKLVVKVNKHKMKSTSSNNNPNKPNNIPCIIIHGNEKGTFVLIDVAVSRNRNVIKKLVEMMLKYKYIIIEI
jgi:hypothetical protein